MTSTKNMTDQLWEGQTASGPVIVLFDQAALAVLDQHRQYGMFKQKEACGILIGQYRGPHLRVTAVTPPQPSDFRTPVFYHRKASPHQALLDQHIAQHGSTHCYLGEWHSHPQKHASPSMMDWAEWRLTIRLSKFRQQRLLFLILGTVSDYLAIAEQGNFYLINRADLDHHSRGH